LSDDTLAAFQRTLAALDASLARMRLDRDLDHLARIVAEATAAASPPKGGLDAAWAEAEAALPGGWRIDYLSQKEDRTAWGVWARDRWVPGKGPHGQAWAEGPTPEAALRALTARLRPTPEPDPE
jgi:hypothetical protein